MNDQDDARESGRGRDSGRGLDKGDRELEAGTRLRAGVAPFFDHEKLVAFQVAQQCYDLIAPWLKRKMPEHVRNQFDRAMLSVVSNIAEGAGKTSFVDKRRSYEIAKGSTTEAAAQLEIIRMREFISPNEYQQARTLLIRVARLLHGLCGSRK